MVVSTITGLVWLNTFLQFILFSNVILILLMAMGYLKNTDFIVPLNWNQTLN